jgi:multiple antibiotic resistance protein
MIGGRNRRRRNPCPPPADHTIISVLAELITDYVALFVIVNPVGTVPLFLGMTVHDGIARRRRTAVFAAATCAATLAGAAVGGEALFAFFGITLDAFRIAGGVLLFLIALDMVQVRTSRTRTTDEEVEHGIERHEVGLIPLGIPMLAGPGAITTVLVAHMRAGAGESAHAWSDPHLWTLLLAVGALGATVLALLWFAAVVERWLNPVVLGVLMRLEGLLLAAIAVQMAVTGLAGAFPVLSGGAAPGHAP